MGYFRCLVIPLIVNTYEYKPFWNFKKVKDVKEKIFRVSELPEIQMPEINSNDAMLISDRTNDGKWVSKKISVDRMTKFLSQDKTITGMVDKEIIKSAGQSGPLRPIINNTVDTEISVQTCKDGIIYNAISSNIIEEADHGVLQPIISSNVEIAISTALSAIDAGGAF